LFGDMEFPRVLPIIPEGDEVSQIDLVIVPVDNRAVCMVHLA